jgi:hypothetical protein
MCGDADHFPALQLPFVGDVTQRVALSISNFSAKIGDRFAVASWPCGYPQYLLGFVDFFAMHNKCAASLMARYCAANLQLSIQINWRNISCYNIHHQTLESKNMGIDRRNGGRQP